jgi:hypothetical protein
MHALPQIKKKKIHAWISFRLTWKIPGVMLVDVDLPDDVNSETLLLYFPLQIEPHELQVGWMEPEAREHQVILFVFLLLVGDPL